MCRIISVADCGFVLDGRSGLADGTSWDRGSDAAVNRMITEAYSPKVPKVELDAKAAVTAATVSKKVLSIGGVRR